MLDVPVIVRVKARETEFSTRIGYIRFFKRIFSRLIYFILLVSFFTQNVSSLRLEWHFKMARARLECSMRVWVIHGKVGSFRQAWNVSWGIDSKAKKTFHIYLSNKIMIGLFICRYEYLGRCRKPVGPNSNDEVENEPQESSELSTLKSRVVHITLRSRWFSFNSFSIWRWSKLLYFSVGIKQNDVIHFLHLMK